MSENHLEVGRRCLLAVMGRRQLVQIQNVSENNVEVSCINYQLLEPGMQAYLEFQGESGFLSYEAEIERLPQEPGDFLVLECRPQQDQASRRSAWRIPADFSTSFKRHTHPRRYLLPVINVSQGGLLIRTDFPVDMGENVDLDFTPPSGEREMLTAQVVHINEKEVGRTRGFLVGLRFIGTDPVTQRNLGGYIWKRIHDLFPGMLETL